MKKLIKILFTLIIVIVGAALVVPFLIPVDTYKKEAIARLSEMTGREIAVNGDISFRIIPDVAVVLDDVTIGNPKGFQSPHLLKVKHLNVGVALGPLFNKELVIQRFELENPDIYLETRNQKQNWQIEFNAPSQPEVGNTVAKSGADAPADGEASFSLKKMELSKLSISKGQLVYMDGAVKQVIENISLASGSVNLNKPTEFNGGLTWNGEAFEIKTRVDSLQQLMDGVATDAVVAIDSSPFKINFNGKLSTTSIRGHLDAGSPSLTRAMKWLGQPLDWTATPLLVAVKGQTNCTLSRCEISGADLALDDIRLKGNLSAGFAGKPAIMGDLSTGTLDITPYMAAKTASHSYSPFISQAFADAPRWSNDAIDVSGLSAADVDVILTAEHIILPELSLKKVKIQPQIRSGSASINIIQSQVFDGGMSGVVTAIPRGDYINVSANIKLQGVDIEQALQTLSGDAAISGKTNLTTALTARGKSVASIIQTLSGNANLAIADGAIKGVNLGQMARNAKSAFLNSSAGSSTEQTDFASLTASFAIQNGIISNSDLAMKAPFLRLTGKGSINLPAYSINYRLLPELVETSKGQGGKDKTGIAVPVLVTGQLDNPKFAPDLQSMLENPEQIKENIGAIKDRIKEGKVEFKENKTEVKQQFQDIKKAIKEDPSKLLENPDQINDQLNNLLKGF